MELRCYQAKAVNAIIDRFDDGDQRTMFTAATGTGKCLGRGTPVLMFDGTIRHVEDIRVGDLLMGPDSQPREVLSTCSGMDHLFKVIPTKGDPYIVNSVHVLSLRMTNQGQEHQRTQPDGTIVNISVDEYLKKSRTFKHCAKGYRVAVNFSHQPYIPLDPYFLGLWLGDGTIRCPDITTADPEVKDYLKKLATSEGLRYVEKPQPNNQSSVCELSRSAGNNKNRLYECLGMLGVTKHKHVPSCYKATDRDTRLLVLAGLIDSDGSREGVRQGRRLRRRWRR